MIIFFLLRHCILTCSMFGMVLEKLYIAEIQKLSDPEDKKLCAVGIAKLLTEAPALYQGNYNKFWYVHFINKLIWYILSFLPPYNIHKL